MATLALVSDAINFVAVTPDALLAIALNVAIPSTLAVAGGILAVNEFGVDRLAQRRRWIVFFVGVWVLAIVLAFVQQVRTTTQQTIAAQKAAANELRNSNDNKYIQGQLDTIRQVMTAFLQQGGPEKAITPFVRALEGVLKTISAQAAKASQGQTSQPSPVQSSAPPAQAPLNVQGAPPNIQVLNLKREAGALMGEMARFDSRFIDEEHFTVSALHTQRLNMEAKGDQTKIDKENARYASERTDLLARASKQFSPLRTRAIRITTRMLDRIPPPQQPLPDEAVTRLLDYGDYNGQTGVLNTYIDKLVKLLPDK